MVFWPNIKAQGQVLFVREYKELWMNGVQPGGIAATGESKDKAYSAFRNAYKTVLFDIASEAEDFTTFKLKVEWFFNQVCGPTKKEWWDAVKKVKKEGTGLV